MNGAVQTVAVSLAAASALLGAGCSSTRGPDLVVNSHVEYNKAIIQVMKEELLLNVVRRRYLEPLQFVSVSSISTSIGMTTDVGASATLDNSATNSSSSWGVGAGGGDFSRSNSGVGTGLNLSNIGVSGGVTFSDSPTVTITPRQGEDIARQLHQPVSVSVVADLAAAGYPLDSTIHLVVEGINDVRGPTLRYDMFQPGSTGWREVMGLIERFTDEGRFMIGRFRWNDPYNDYAFPAESITPSMWITTLSTGAHRWKSYDGGKTFFFTSHEMAPAAWLDPEMRKTQEGGRFMELLNIRPDVQKRLWLLEAARVVEGPDLEDMPDARRPTLKLRMRSLYNVINLFAYTVEVPPEDESTGRATNLSTFREAVARGESVDFPESVRVQWNDRRPAHAFITVPYRGLWFYIADTDLKSKMAFNALYDLWQLSVKTPAAESTPVTTIQVN